MNGRADSPPASAEAWLLGLPDGSRLALAVAELVHLLPEPPTLQTLAEGPPHRRLRFRWQGRQAVALDPGAWFCRVTRPPTLLAVVGFDDAGAGPATGGLLLREIPQRVRVSDAQARGPRAVDRRWLAVSLAAFEHAGQTVPVLDLARLFDARFAPEAAGTRSASADCGPRGSGAN